jgi:hypothetical protein
VNHLHALAVGAGEGPACACSGATSWTASRGIARACSTSRPSAPLTASTTPRYSRLCSTCRGSPRPRAHTHQLPRSWLQKQLIVPAVQGTLNVLRAAKEAGGVRRVGPVRASRQHSSCSLPSLPRSSTCRGGHGTTPGSVRPRGCNSRSDQFLVISVLQVHIGIWM